MIDTWADKYIRWAKPKIEVLNGRIAKGERMIKNNSIVGKPIPKVWTVELKKLIKQRDKLKQACDDCLEHKSKGV